MPLKEAPYYWLECDTCGDRCEYGDFAAMADPGQAIDGALDSEWTTDGQKYNCPGCPILAQCERCKKPAGEDAAERDDYCEACWPLVNTGPAQ